MTTFANISNHNALYGRPDTLLGFVSLHTDVIAILSEVILPKTCAVLVYGRGSNDICLPISSCPV